MIRVCNPEKALQDLLCKCKRCGYEWAARVEKPKACPECKRRDWAKDNGK